MNPLEMFKEKMRAKPGTEQMGTKQIDIVIPVATQAENVTLRNITIEDTRLTEKPFDMDALTRKLKDKRLHKIVIKTGDVRERQDSPIQLVELQPSKKAKKLGKVTLQLLQEEGVSIVPEKDVGEMDDDIQLDIEDLDRVDLDREDVVKKPRRTKKQPKGVSIIPPEAWVEIGETAIEERLPEKKPKVNFKVSSYYMNNREIFVNFINSLFEPYRNDVLDDSKNISCDDMDKGIGELALLTHQKLVRDYLNLYTPYRGLLLYHGLGSGKTATSIAIAEGMKSTKKVIIMTPASLEENYRSELKRFGDPMYKLNQCWEWIDTKKNPEALETLSGILNLTKDYIEKKGGAWLVNVSKPIGCNDDNYGTAKDETGKKQIQMQKQKDQESLDAQINVMIDMKYEFIHYNGLRKDKLRKMTDNFEKNIFDDAVVIIDEAHNLISRIVNKLSKEKEIATDKYGNKARVSFSLSLILYEMLMSAKNARIVLLSGTPIINYPNEMGILFNILRGYIKTWEIPLDVKSSQKITADRLGEIFLREKSLDYIDYSSSSKMVTVTRNPFGFENKEKKGSGYMGITNEKKGRKDESGKMVLQDRGILSDQDFEKRIIRILNQNDIEIFPSAVRVVMNKALPDRLEEFSTWFIEPGTVNIKNTELFKRRIMGLSSYFKSAQEKLLPRYEKISDFHVEKIPMSDEQFAIYERARSQERQQEKQSKKKKGKVDANGIFSEPTSTYRIFSRLYCNFVMPPEIGRPLPREDREAALQEGKEDEGKDGKGKDGNIEKLYEDITKNADKMEKKDDEDREGEGVIEGDEMLNKFADAGYDVRIKNAMRDLKLAGAKYLSPEGLETYSPKYLRILENITDEDHKGLHLVYSQFLTMEGLGIFKLVLEQNGYAEFKIKKDPNGIWKINIAAEDRGKPTFAVYTGTQTKEEKEIIRKIYNGMWGELSPSLSTELRKMSANNNLGEVVRVLMITASGSEGINLRNTRYVHLMEPYWHPARIEQVVGRARRICSHKDLPDELQTVEVFMYLMNFTKEQLKSDLSIEMKLKDLSKKEYQMDPENPKLSKTPFTSDEALFEISTIKAELSMQLITAMKEASIDCAIYSKTSGQEQLHCLQFGEPGPNSYSYAPSITNEPPDSTTKQNKKTIEWTGKEMMFQDKKYIYRKIDETHGNAYDVESYQRARIVPGVVPMLMGTLTKLRNGNMEFKKVAL